MASAPRRLDDEEELREIEKKTASPLSPGSPESPNQESQQSPSPREPAGASVASRRSSIDVFAEVPRRLATTIASYVARQPVIQAMRPFASDITGGHTCTSITCEMSASLKFVDPTLESAYQRTYQAQHKAFLSVVASSMLFFHTVFLIWGTASDEGAQTLPQWMHLLRLVPMASCGVCLLLTSFHFIEKLTIEPVLISLFGGFSVYNVVAMLGRTQGWPQLDQHYALGMVGVFASSAIRFQCQAWIGLAHILMYLIMLLASSQSGFTGSPLFFLSVVYLVLVGASYQRERQERDSFAIHTKLEYLAAKVASMELEEAQQIFSKSPSPLELSLLKILSALSVYRPYLPDTLFCFPEVAVSDIESLDDDTKDAVMVSLKERPDEPPPVHHHHHHRGAVYPNTSVKLVRRRVTLMHLYLEGFHNFAQLHPIEDVEATVKKLVDETHDQIKKHNGHILYFSGPLIVGVWNAVQDIAAHQIQAVACGFQVQQELNHLATSIARHYRDPSPSSCGVRQFSPFVAIASDQAVLGNVDTRVRKAFHLFGGIKDTSQVLSKLAAYLDVPIIATENIVVSTAHQVSTRPVDVISYERYNAGIPTKIHQVLCPLVQDLSDRNDDWMYASPILRASSGSDSMDLYQKGFSLFVSGKYKEATEALLDYASYDPMMVQRFAPRVAETRSMDDIAGIPDTTVRRLLALCISAQSAESSEPLPVPYCRRITNTWDEFPGEPNRKKW